MSTKKNWSDLNLVSYGRAKKGLKDALTDKPILDEKESNFDSLIPSRGNTPSLPLVATYSNYAKNGIGYVKGAIYFDEKGEYHEISLNGETYDFIDGFDHGLARVYKNIGGQKKWGIVGLIVRNGKPEIEKCQETFDENGDPKYDNIWNFYDKTRKHIPAYLNGIMEDLSLEKIRENLRKKSNVDASNQYSNKENDLEDHSQEEDSVTIGEIEVKNFKRFSEPTTMDLSSRITFIVGKNNAGKSSLLDAVELFMYNLYHFNEHVTDEGDPYFCFAKDREKVLQDELFKDYLNRDSSDSKILLSCKSGEWHFEIQLDGKAGRDSSLIDTITISNKDSKVKFKKGETCVWLDRNASPLLFKAQGKWIFHKDNNKSGLEGLFYYLLPKNVIEGIENSVEYPNTYDYVAEKVAKRIGGAGKEIRRNNIEEKINRIKNSIDNATTTSYNLERLHVFASIGKKKYENRSISLNVDNKEYIWYHGFVSESICDYYTIDDCSDSKNNIYHHFVCKWLERMEMGEDFVISKDGEDFTIKIKNNDVGTDLCYMGSGTIHFVALCFKLLFLADKYKKSGRFAATLLIEEPEQNLHPMLQSHIANFLLDVSLFFEKHTLFPLKMVVETHSEYIIRKSQVLAKEHCKKGNDISSFAFKTYYFPSINDRKKKPYDMKYCDDGRFYERFGFGFFDEASELAMQVF